MLFKSWNHNTRGWHCLGDVAEYERGSAWLRRAETLPNKPLRAFCTEKDEEPPEGGGQDPGPYETHEIVVPRSLWETARGGTACKVKLICVVLRGGRERTYALKTESYMMNDSGETIERL